MMKQYTAVCLGLALVGSMACGGDFFAPGEEETGVTLVTQLDYGEDSEVESIEYTVTPVSCETGEVYEDGDVFTSTMALKNLTLPGGIGTFVDAPFDEFSEHQFADYFILLDAGCYTVHVQPVDEDGSAICLPVETPDPIEVVDGKTTEILLVSQCSGKKKGALDVIAALNYPPAITTVNLIPQKFNKCPIEGNPIVTICVEAEDPDLDSILIEWKDFVGSEEVISVEVLENSSYSDPGFAGQCIEVTFPRKDAGYKGKVTVFDQFVKYVNSQRKLITAEDWYLENGFGEIKSRASQKFPIYIAGCEEEFVCARSSGYWMSPVGEQSTRQFEMRKEKWDETEYVIETQELCPGELWDDELQPSPVGLYGRLAFQYIPAKLNLSNGATEIGSIVDYIAMAEALLTYGDICAVKSRLEDPNYVENALVAAELWEDYQADFASVEQLKDALEGFNTFCSSGG